MVNAVYTAMPEDVEGREGWKQGEYWWDWLLWHTEAVFLCVFLS